MYCDFQPKFFTCKILWPLLENLTSFQNQNFLTLPNRFLSTILDRPTFCREEGACHGNPSYLPKPGHTHARLCPSGHKIPTELSLDVHITITLTLKVWSLLRPNQCQEEGPYRLICRQLLLTFFSHCFSYWFVTLPYFPSFDWDQFINSLIFFLKPVLVSGKVTRENWEEKV